MAGWAQSGDPKLAQPHIEKFWAYAEDCGTVARLGFAHPLEQRAPAGKRMGSLRGCLGQAGRNRTGDLSAWRDLG